MRTTGVPKDSNVNILSKRRWIGVLCSLQQLLDRVLVLTVEGMQTAGHSWIRAYKPEQETSFIAESLREIARISEE